MAIAPTPFESPGVVRPEWIDANGHMNVIYYMQCFYQSSDAFFDFIGISFDYQLIGKTSIMTLGSNIDYRSELLRGERLSTTSRLLDWDHSKVHLYFETWNSEHDRLAANAEILFLYVNLQSRKSEKFQVDTREKLAEVHSAHRRLETPATINRSLGIRRKD